MLKPPFHTEVLFTRLRPQDPVLGRVMHGRFPSPTWMLHTGWSSCAVSSSWLGSATPCRPVLLCADFLAPPRFQQPCLAATAASWLEYLPHPAWGQTPCSGPPWLHFWSPNCLRTESFGKGKGGAFFFSWSVFHSSNELLFLAHPAALPPASDGMPWFLLWWNTLLCSQYMCFRQDWLHSCFRDAHVSPSWPADHILLAPVISTTFYSVV